MNVRPVVVNRAGRRGRFRKQMELAAALSSVVRRWWWTTMSKKGGRAKTRRKEYDDAG